MNGVVWGNALQAAVVRGNWGIGALLLSKGAEVDPPGPEWEALLSSVEKQWGTDDANRLRKLQENPTVEGLVQMRKDEEEEWLTEEESDETSASGGDSEGSDEWDDDSEDEADNLSGEGQHGPT